MGIFFITIIVIIIIVTIIIVMILIRIFFSAGLSEYFVFDKQKYTLEEFFSDIKTFKVCFHSCFRILVVVFFVIVKLVLSYTLRCFSWLLFHFQVSSKYSHRIIFILFSFQRSEPVLHEKKFQSTIRFFGAHSLKNKSTQNFRKPYFLKKSRAN